MNAFFLAQAGSLSVHEVLKTYTAHSCPHQPKLKWVNDIFLGGKKIGGVLPKAESQGGSCYAWIGIGVNINNIPIEGATCLRDQIDGNQEIETLPFITKLAKAFMENVSNLEKHGFAGIKPQLE